MPETRKAVEAWRGVSAAAISAASTPSDSVEADTCVKDAVDANAAAPPAKNCLELRTVWTPPEALTTVATAAMIDPPEEGSAAVAAERERVGIAADAYAFGMIAWEVREVFSFLLWELHIGCGAARCGEVRCVFCVYVGVMGAPACMRAWVCVRARVCFCACARVRGVRACLLPSLCQRSACLFARQLMVCALFWSKFRAELLKQNERFPDTW